MVVVVDSFGAAAYVPATAAVEVPAVASTALMVGWAQEWLEDEVEQCEEVRAGHGRETWGTSSA